MGCNILIKIKDAFHNEVKNDMLSFSVMLNIFNIILKVNFFIKVSTLINSFVLR